MIWSNSTTAKAPLGVLVEKLSTAKNLKNKIDIKSIMFFDQKSTRVSEK